MEDGTVGTEARTAGRREGGEAGPGRVRRNIWDLEAGGPWDPVTLAYAEAVRAMQGRRLADPTSWWYQAAIHGREGRTPSGAVWNQCQHGGWFFLPWHRMYLYWFERIVRAEVTARGGSANWALPYWDYDEAGQAQLPPAFREPALPDGTANPLFVQDREPVWNRGAAVPPAVASSGAAMAAVRFTPPPAPGFGGGRTRFAHFFGAAGELEFTPHNGVHSIIGGWMGDPGTAALDPIFWLHHANVDRLWAVWLSRGGGRADPVDPAWRGQRFVLHDETGAQVQMTVAEVLDTAVLGYSYQDVAETASTGPAAEAAAESRLRAGTSAEPEPEFVGASERPLDLEGKATRIDVVIDRSAVAARRRESADAPPARVHLHLEDIEAERNPATVYQVLVGVPGQAGAPEPVGTVSFFGVQHVASSDAPHGLRRTFDITAPVERLRAEGVWNDEQLQVSLQPVRPVLPPELEPPAGTARELTAAEAAPVRIGRVSVSYG